MPAKADCTHDRLVFHSQGFYLVWANPVCGQYWCAIKAGGHEPDHSVRRPHIDDGERLSLKCFRETYLDERT
jgi:hypothetical protein